MDQVNLTPEEQEANLRTELNNMKLEILKLLHMKKSLLTDLNQLEVERNNSIDQKIQLSEQILEDMKQLSHVQRLQKEQLDELAKLQNSRSRILNTDEQNYVDTLIKILKCKERPDRTGVGTKSIFGVNMSFDLSDGQLPLMTQRKLSWKNIWTELLFFLRGQTDATILREQGVHIWDGNSSREFLDRIGLTDRAEFDLGPVYGWQWRHFGATYIDCKTDYTGQGIDQLAEVINIIKKDPYSRRLMVSAWNPTDLKEMVLPPCHHSFQFYVHDGKLSCLVNQRSGDMVLGIPYNIASYSLLTHIVARITGLAAEKLHLNIGDAHIYQNHIAAAEAMIKLQKYPLPKIRWLRAPVSIDDIQFEDIVLENYTSGPAIQFQMAI